VKPTPQGKPDHLPVTRGFSLRALTAVLLIAVAALAVAIAYYTALRDERAGYAALSRSEVDRLEARLGLAESAVRALLQQADAYVQLKDSLQAQNARVLLGAAATAVRELREISRTEAARVLASQVIATLEALGTDLQPLRTNAELAQLEAQVTDLDRQLLTLTSRMNALVGLRGLEVTAVAEFYDDRIAASRRTAFALIPVALLLAVGGGFLFYRLVLLPLDQLGRATESAIGRGEPFRVDLLAPGCLEIRHVREGASRLFLQLDGMVRERTARLEEALKLSDERNAQLVVAEQQVRRSREQFAEVFETAPAALLLAHAGGEVALVNRAAERILGLPREEMFGRRIPELLRDAELLDDSGKQLELLLTRHERGRVLRLHRAGPAEFFGELEARTFTREEGDGLLVQINDVTQREQRLRTEQRSQRLESIGTLAGGIAHDLNNTLAPISMAIEKLRLTYPGEDRILATLHNCCKRGAGMVRQLLTFAKGSPGDMRPVDCRLLLDELASMIRATFPRNIALHVSLEEGAPAVVGDVTLLFQALLNLCVNARDAMPDGGRLDLSLDLCSGKAPTRDAAGEATAPWIMIKVGDTGCGMSPEIQARIFDPFFTTKSADRGTGLGLSTTLGIVRGHGGRVEVESYPGRGTTFSILLPAGGPETRENPEGDRGAITPAGSGRRVLIVDDEGAIRQVITALLESAGFAVEEATDGAEALSRLLSPREKFDLVVTDVVMPRVDGLELIRQVRAAGRQVPVVVIGAAIIPAQEKELLALGAAAVIPKPFSQAELFAVVSETIAGAAAAD
jgi:PAS domain S-box-containing protein